MAGDRIKCSISDCIEDAFIDGVCSDHWSGYDLCKACGDYRCEHMTVQGNELSDPEWFSCHCENFGCREGFVEGSTRRVISLAEFRALRRTWGHDVPEPDDDSRL
jgi:hypothetical protein